MSLHGCQASQQTLNLLRVVALNPTHLERLTSRHVQGQQHSIAGVECPDRLQKAHRICPKSRRLRALERRHQEPLQAQAGRMQPEPVSAAGGQRSAGCTGDRRHNGPQGAALQHDRIRELQGEPAQHHTMQASSIIESSCSVAQGRRRKGTELCFSIFESENFKVSFKAFFIAYPGKYSTA